MRTESLDPGRGWFRYHRLLADFLRLELRRTLPAEVPVLHRRAAERFLEQGQVAEAVRHTQAAGNTARWYSGPWIADLLLSPLDGCFQLGAVTWFRHSERKPLLEAWLAWIVRLGDAELLDRISGMCSELILLSANDGGADPTMRYSRGSRPAT